MAEILHKIRYRSVILFTVLAACGAFGPSLPKRVKKQRKHYTGEEKVGILRRRLLENVAVSDLCEELGLQPTVFYRWQKERRGGLRAQGRRTQPSSRAGTHRLSGKEDSDQG